jgi:UDP-N-acetylmuramyl tripeptide synthase
VADAGLDGRLVRPGAVGVFEVDEAALGVVAGNLHVSHLLLLNLFRDQLDRFGETDALVRQWEVLLGALPATSSVISCGDDPRLARLVAERPGPSIAYGLSAPPAAALDVSLTLDVSSCPRCDRRLDRRWTSVGHLGEFACAGCGFQRSEPAVGVRIVASRGIDGQTLAFRTPGSPGERSVTIGLPGMSNAYNTAAAVAAATSLGVPADLAVDALADASPAFGRFEDVVIEGRRVVLALGKNPASVEELIRVGLESQVAAVLFAVNDAFADGQDVSWFWDVDVAPLLDGRPFAVSGDRATDFLLRIKYGGPDATQGIPRGLVSTAEDPGLALDSIVAATPSAGTVLVVATYTALMGLRRGLVGRGLLPDQPR